SRLVGSLRIIAAETNGAANGHLSWRDPDDPETFWLNGDGVRFADVERDDLVHVDGEGRVIAGHRPVLAGAFSIHSAVLAARPDVQSVLHVHAPASMAWSTFGRVLDPIVQDSCVFFEDQAVMNEFVVATDGQEGRAIAATVGAKKAVVLTNHGLVTVGGSMDAAVAWMLRFERCADVQLRAEGAGRPGLIAAGDARHIASLLGTERAGRATFAAYWEGYLRRTAAVSSPGSVT
ncbi:MAG TPA: class II aldolase/adducin family protein, partial [Ilumatobacteraceae bacterium]